MQLLMSWCQWRCRWLDGRIRIPLAREPMLSGSARKQSWFEVTSWTLYTNELLIAGSLIQNLTKGRFDSDLDWARFFSSIEDAFCPFLPYLAATISFFNKETTSRNETDSNSLGTRLTVLSKLLGRKRCGDTTSDRCLEVCRLTIFASHCKKKCFVFFQRSRVLVGSQGLKRTK